MKTVIYLLIFILLANLVSANNSINIQVAHSFLIGETTSFQYTLTSDQDQKITYIAHIICPNAPIAMLQQKTTNLKANQPFTETYQDIKVTEDIEPQTCTAYVQILSPIQIKEEKSFEIKTNPSFDFEIRLCKDKECGVLSKVFTKEEDIYLTYFSGVDSPIINATLINTNKEFMQITLPAKLSLNEIGTYELEVTVSKEGYKTKELKEQFGVIKREAQIKDASICNGDNICNNKENNQNCPQDCLYGEGKTLIYLYIYLISGTILILGLIIIIIKKRRKNDTQNI